MAPQEGDPKTKRPKRVLLADHHTLFRRGLAGLMASYAGLEVIEELPNDQEALRLAREERPTSSYAAVDALREDQGGV